MPDLKKKDGSMTQKIVLIGAGSQQFGFDTMGDIFQSEVLPGSCIVLHDINPEALEKVRQVGQRFVADNNLDFAIEATIDRKEALKGASFVISSIEVGNRIALWDQDWRIPQQFGFKQVTGENGGPGGLFHALRVTPPILEICGDIMDICPEAAVFNYSNPMSRICTTVHRKYPELKLVGLCHEIASIPQHLPNILGVPMDNIHFRAGGLNHFSVLLEVRYKDSGKDAYPDVLAKAPSYFEDMPSLKAVIDQLKAADAGPTPGSDPVFRENCAGWSERWMFKKFLDIYGLMPITTDSHLGEYPAWAHDAVDHQGVLEFCQIYRQYILEKAPEIELKLHERVIPIIEGILTGSGYEEAAVNVPNQGAIENLPDWIVVEVPATVDGNGVHGVSPGTLPRGYAGLLYNQVAIHDMTAEAVLSGSRDVVLQALLVDPMVDKAAAAEKLLDAMLEIQKPYLSYIQ